MTAVSLRQIALEQGTDKEGPHSYTDAYERHLGHLRRRPITLLEIGIGGYSDPSQGGASLRMWKEYFPLGKIIGLDIADKTSLAEDRITILQGNQADRAFLERIADEHGPFDVVIDDGSHRCRHVIASFEALFPRLADDGIYVIEDLQTSYWETYGGSSGTDRSGTSMAYLQSLVDGLNFAEFDIPGYQPTYTDRWVKAVTFYHNLAFIQRGPNLEPSHLLPPHPRDTRQFARRPARNQGSPSGVVRRVVRRIVPRRVRLAVVRLGQSRDRRGGPG
jgi:Methyltransferase domain